MSISTKIVYVNNTSTTVTGSPVNLEQDANGFTMHADQQVKDVESTMSASDSSIVFHFEPAAEDQSIWVEEVSVTTDTGTQADRGGVTWSPASPDNRGLNITLTASATVGRKTTFVFDGATQPPVKLKVVVLRG
jgi:hypothetical protein